MLYPNFDNVSRQTGHQDDHTWIICQNLKDTITNKINFFDTLVDQISVIVYNSEKYEVHI